MKRQPNSYKHGLARTPEHNSWQNMKRRCAAVEGTDHANYGGRGITVCGRWERSFTCFLADMGCKPSPEYTLDRVNNSGNYEPGNCRWATRALQSFNQRVRSDNTTRYTGVAPLPDGSYRAYINVKKVQIALGVHSDLTAAVSARQAAEAKYY